MFSGLREIDAAGQGVGGAVGDGERFVEVLRLQDGEHGAEDFFLGDGRRRRHVGEDVRGDVGAFAHEKAEIAGVGEPGFLLALFDVAEDALAGFVVDDGADLAAGIFRGADLQAARRLDRAVPERCRAAVPGR